jgi:hypothetical protein
MATKGTKFETVAMKGNLDGNEGSAIISNGIEEIHSYIFAYIR